MDRLAAYLISLGIVGFGIVWIVAGANSPIEAVLIGIGVLTVAVGLISLLTELRQETH